MGNKIACLINMFSISQEIIYPGGRKDYVPLEDLSDYLIAACDENQIYNVHLFGNSNYIQKTVKEIKEKENKLFSENKINIEVN